MEKYKSKLILLITFCIMFLSCINIVKADSNFKDTKTSNLYEKCNETNKCIPICVYSTVSGDEDEKDYNNGEKAYIGYYYDYNNTKTNAWEIGEIRIHTTHSDFWGTKYHKTLYTTFDTRLPKTDIYWGGYGKDGNITWDNATIGDKEPYKDIYENFECPQYINVDKDGTDIELCFSNDKGKCEEQESVGTNFKEKMDHPIKYSFTEELEKIINETYKNLYIFTSPNPSGADSEANKKIKFLADIDSDFKQKYDENKSAHDNALEFCPLLEEKLKDEDKYFNSIGKENEYRNIINKQLQESTKKFDVKNKTIYTDETLSSILTLTDASGNKTYRQVLDPTGQPYIEKLHSIYGENIRTSINYVKDMCNALPDKNIEYDEKKLVDTVKTKYESTIYEKIQIDTQTQFSCGTLGELADIVKTGYFIIEIIAIVILVVFTALDYAKVILSGEQDEMKKTNKRLTTRLIIAVVILLLPALINFVLGVFNIEGFNSDNPLCVEIKNK